MKETDSEQSNVESLYLASQSAEVLERKLDRKGIQKEQEFGREGRVQFGTGCARKASEKVRDLSKELNRGEDRRSQREEPSKKGEQHVQRPWGQDCAWCVGGTVRGLCVWSRMSQGDRGRK